MKEGNCRHFNGLPMPIGKQEKEKCCEAGVNYRAHVGGPDHGWFTRTPCLPMLRKPTDQMVPCPKFVAVTAEEEAADKAEMDKGFALILQGLSICCEAPLTARNVAGWQHCSKCQGAAIHSCPPRGARRR